MAAFGFSVTDYGRRSEWWSADSIAVTEAVMMVVAGAAIGMTAWMCVVALESRSIHVIARRLGAVFVLVPLLAIVLHRGAVAAGLEESSDPKPTIVLLGTHATCVLITSLLVFRQTE